MSDVSTETDQSDAQDELSQAKARIAELEMELMDKNLELNHYLLRSGELESEVEKVKKRSAREADKVVERNRRELLVSFLDVVDDFDRALTSEAFIEGRRDTEAKAVIDGVKLIHRRLLAKLAELGVAPMDALGQPFDPNEHEAAAMVAATSSNQAGTVVAVARRGYALNGDVLRPAVVTVAK